MGPGCRLFVGPGSPCSPVTSPAAAVSDLDGARVEASRVVEPCQAGSVQWECCFQKFVMLIALFISPCEIWRHTFVQEECGFAPQTGHAYLPNILALLPRRRLCVK